MTGAFGVLFARPEIAALVYGAPLLVVFYLLRRPAARVDVPFLPFWEKVLATQARKPSAARLFLSLLLQTAAYVLLVALAAGPFREERVVPPRDAVLVVDRTGPAAPFSAAVLSRAETAAREALRDGGIVEIVAWTGSGLRTLDRTPEFERAAARLRTAPPARGPRDVEEADRFLRTTPLGTEIVVVTPFALPERPGLRRAAVVAAVGFDPAVRNGGILAATMRAAEVECAVAADPGRLLRVTGPDGSFAEAPASRRTMLALPGEDGPWRLELAPADPWPEDDAVDLPARRGGLLRVLVVAAEDTPALDAALAASGLADPARSSRAAPAAWRDVARNYDVTVLVGRDELTPPPPGRYLLLDSTAPGAGVVRTGGYGRTRVVAPIAPTPWLRGLDPDEWEIRRAGEFVAAAETEVLAAGERGPLAFRAAGEGSRFLGLLVPPTPAASTLPLLPAFPWLVRGALLELDPRSAAAEGATTRPAAADAPGAADLPAVDRTAPDPPAAPPSGPPVRRSAAAGFAAALGAVLLAEWLLYHAGRTD